MECEENILQEQIKCREVVKARVDPLETELKALRLGDGSRNMQLREKNERIISLEREIGVEKELQSKLRAELSAT